jgi:hypothetical protein
MCLCHDEHVNMLLPLVLKDFNRHNRLARKFVTMSLSLEKDLFSHFSFGHFEMSPRGDDGDGAAFAV